MALGGGKALSSELEGAAGPALGEGPAAPLGWPVGVRARQVKQCPSRLLFFNYSFILYLLEGEAGGETSLGSK